VSQNQTMQPVGYVISAKRDDGTKHYMGIDRSSGGYEYWTGLSGAQIYGTESEADAALVKHDDGRAFLHRVTDASNAKPNRYADISIEQLTTRTLSTKRVMFNVDRDLA
jgi:hypothetical protein